VIDQSQTSEVLPVGEAYQFTFNAIVDPDAADDQSQPLMNQATATGDGANFDGTLVTVTDDSGANGMVDDMGVDNDAPSVLEIPEIRTTKTITDITPNGSNYDITIELTVENTGTTDLTNIDLFDDLNTQAGGGLVGVLSVALDTTGVGTGTAPTLNFGGTSALANPYDGGVAGADSDNLLNSDGTLPPGEFVTVTLVYTLDPTASTLSEFENTATGGGEDPSGTAVTDPSDSGTDPNGNNSGEPGDTGGHNDPTRIIIADVSAAKQVVGTPTQLPNGNFEAIYQVVIENTGTVDLADLTLTEDLFTQFNGAYVDAYDLALTVAPADPTSNIALDIANWNGGSNTEIVNTVIPSLLAVGDSFIFEFKVEIDPTAITGVLNNQVTVGGDAVDENGVPYLDSNGVAITATDDSDSGTDPADDNPGAPGDMGTSDDPTPLVIPAADLVTVKELASGTSTPAEGEVVTFEIEVTNNGPDTATGWDIGSIASGATVTLTLEGTVDVGEGGNTITNITTAASGEQFDPSTVGDDLEAEVIVEDLADLITEKTLISGNATPAEGDSVTFQIAVTNDGAAQATGVSLVDLLPAGLTFTGSSVTQGTYNATTGLFDIGTLNVGDIAILTLTGTVDVGEGGNSITNVTTAAMGDQVDPRQRRSGYG